MSATNCVIDENDKLKTITSPIYNLVYSKLAKSSCRYGESFEQDARFGFFGPEVVYINCIDDKKHNCITFEQFINILHKMLYCEYINTNSKQQKIYKWSDKIRTKHDNKFRTNPISLEYYVQHKMGDFSINCNKKSALYKIILIIDKLDENINKIIDYLYCYQIDINLLIINPSYMLSKDDLNVITVVDVNTFILFSDNPSFDVNMKYELPQIQVWCPVTNDNTVDILYKLKKYKKAYWYFFVSQFSKENTGALFTSKKVTKQNINSIIKYCFDNQINFNFDQLSYQYLHDFINSNKSLTDEDKNKFELFLQPDESGLFNCVVDSEGNIYKSLINLQLKKPKCNMLNYSDFLQNVWIDYFLKDLI